MTHTYIIDGITCNGCVAKVKSKLLSNPDISAADVSLEDHTAVISMQKHLSLEDLQNTIGQDTKYTIREDVSHSPHHAMASVNSFSWIETYKPLLIIAAFHHACCHSYCTRDLMVGMNHFMAGFFSGFSRFLSCSI